MTTLLLAYLAGLLTLINPCVLPVLPIVLTASLGADARGPLALAAGMSLSFVILGLGIAAVGPAVGLYPEDVARVAALVMLVFGMALVSPALGRRFAAATAGIAVAANGCMPRGRGIGRELVGGALLGAVWSPCIGPTLGAAIGLASTGQGLAQAAATMAAFALGVSTLIVAGAYGLRGWLRRNAGRMSLFAARARPALGLAFITVGLTIVTGLHHQIETWLIAGLPAWLIDLSVSL